MESADEKNKSFLASVNEMFEEQNEQSSSANPPDGLEGDLGIVYKLHKELEGSFLTLIYEGDFTQSITKAFVALAEKNMDRNDEDKKTKRTVFNVMVECLQNVSRYSRTDTAIFMITSEGSSYKVASGNVISNDSIVKVEKTLEKINSLDEAGVKQLYRDVMKRHKETGEYGVLPDTGGAGLGFIDMAKKTKNKLEYFFHPIDDKVSFFSFRATIQVEKKS